MIRRAISMLTYANVVATLAMFAAVGGGAYALGAASGAGGVIHGCVSRSTGVLRVVSSSSKCRKPTRRAGSGERAISWNQQGGAGPTGATGSPGAAGAPGQRGPQGPAGEPAATLWADIGPDDKTVLAASDPSITAEPSGVGTFIEFHQNVEGCAILATEASLGAFHVGTVQANVRDPAHPTQVRVDFRETGGGTGSAALNVAVLC